MPKYNSTPCTYCGTVFTPRAYNNKYCSRPCKVKGHSLAKNVAMQARRKIGLCACGQKIENGDWMSREYRTCTRCRTHYTRKEQQHKEGRIEGICFRCGKPTEHLRFRCNACDLPRRQKKTARERLVRSWVLQAYGNACRMLRRNTSQLPKH